MKRGRKGGMKKGGRNGRKEGDRKGRKENKIIEARRGERREE